MTKAPARMLAGAFVVLALALAGCGSSSSGGDEPGGTSSSDSSPGTAAVDPSADRSGAGSESDAGTGARSEDAVADRLTAEANRVRSAEGVPVLEPSACLDAQARERAAAQARERASVESVPPLEHTPLGPVTQHCGAGLRAAENLVDFPAGTGAAEVLEAWMQSPGHRNNLVDPGLRQVGTGCVASEKGTLCSQLYLGPQ